MREQPSVIHELSEPGLVNQLRMVVMVRTNEQGNAFMGGDISADVLSITRASLSLLLPIQPDLGRFGSVVGRDHLLEPRVFQGLLGRDTPRGIVHEHLAE